MSIFRYHFYLQLRKDILEGRLVCPESSAALLGSYAAQCKLGFYYCFIFLSIALCFLQPNLVIIQLRNMERIIWMLFKLHQIKQLLSSEKLWNFINCTSQYYNPFMEYVHVQYVYCVVKSKHYQSYVNSFLRGRQFLLHAPSCAPRE